MSKSYKNKDNLKKIYEKLGSTRRVGKFFSVSNGTICRWMSKFHIPRNPRLEIQDNNSGRGRRGELYIKNHPNFRGRIIDLGEIDDKSKRDLIWDSNSIDVKTSHFKRPIFRIKTKRHKVSFYICLYFIDSINSLIPVEIWIIPSNIAPHSGITPSLIRTNSKYHKYKLSSKRGKEFSVGEEKRYNQKFIKKYLKIIEQKQKKGGKNDKKTK